MARVPDNVIEAMRGSHELGIFLRLDTDDPLRVWVGLNDIPAGIESVDPDTDQVYQGGGALNEIPPLEAVLNGVAERAEFTLSGIDPAAAALIDVAALSVAARGKRFHVGITTLDIDHQPMSSIIPLLTGRASYAAKSMPSVEAGKNATVAMLLSVGFGITTRRRNSQALWSPAHHRANFPDDAFCDGTPRLERGVTPTWPRF